MSIKVALVQTNAGKNTDENIANALFFLKEAIHNKSDWIMFPEMFLLRGRFPNYEDRIFFSIALDKFMRVASKYKKWIFLGSIHEYKECPDEEKENVKDPKYYNTAFLISPDGECVVRYRKIHLFSIKTKKVLINESDMFLTGKDLSMWEIEGFRIGFSICYDLRFPELYRHYLFEGGNLMFIPSSFTFQTGKYHWEPLLKARAIENQSYVIAPNQVGIGAGGVATYGHSMVVNPWGEVCLDMGGKDVGVAYCDIDLSVVKKCRKKLPIIEDAVLFEKVQDACTGIPHEEAESKAKNNNF